MKKLIRCNADLSNRSESSVYEYCDKYMQTYFERYCPCAITSVKNSLDKFANYTLSTGENEYCILDSYVKTENFFADVRIYGIFRDNKFVGFSYAYVDPPEYITKETTKFGLGLLSTIDEYPYMNNKLYQNLKKFGIDKYVYTSLEDMLPYSKLTDVFEKYQELYDRKFVNKPNRTNWKSLVEHLTRDDYDPDEQDDYTEFLDDVCRSIEDKMGLYIEPSVQGGQGGVWIYDNDTNDTLIEDYDYETFHDEIIDLAINSSSKKEFITKYKNYLEGLTK